MLRRSQGHLPMLRSRPVNHPDVLMRLVDPVDVEKTRRDECPRAGLGRGRTLAEQLDVEAALFFGLAQRRLFRVFIQFYVATDRQPLVQLAMIFSSCTMKIATVKSIFPWMWAMSMQTGRIALLLRQNFDEDKNCRRNGNQYRQPFYRPFYRINYFPLKLFFPQVVTFGVSLENLDDFILSQ